MNDINDMRPDRPQHGLGSIDGLLEVELSDRPVRYHIARCFRGEPGPEECRALARSACRVACAAVDIMRGRTPPPALRRAMTETCLRRLEAMAKLVDSHAIAYGTRRETRYYLPAMPDNLEGTLVSPTSLDTSVFMTVGDRRYQANVVLRRIGSRWMCTLADVG